MNFLKKALVLFLSFLSTFTYAQIAKIPFEIKSNNIYIKAQVNKSDSLWFVFDTGSTGTILDSVSAEKAGINENSKHIEEVAEYGGVAKYVTVSGQRVGFQNGFEIQNLNTLLIDLSKSTSVRKETYKGIIGYDILVKYVTTLNFDSKQMSFYNRIENVDTIGYTGFPFEFSKGIMIPRFPISITLNNGDVLSGKVMFDSGASGSLFISAGYKNFHNLSRRIGKTVAKKGLGVNIETNDEKAVIKGMNIGGFKFGKMAIGLAVDDKATPKDGYLGLIGLEIIKHFNVIIDYAHKKIYLKPNRMFKSKFITTIH